MKRIYKELKNLRQKNETIKGIAIEECLSYQKAVSIRKQKEIISNKIFFYDNFIKASKKVRSV